MRLSFAALLLAMPALAAAIHRQIRGRDPSSRSLLAGRRIPHAVPGGAFGNRKTCHEDPLMAGKVKCFPDLMFVGTSKAGTSSVMTVFTSHPQIVSESFMGIDSIAGNASDILGNGKDTILEAHVFDTRSTKREAFLDAVSRPLQTNEDAMNTLLMHYTPNYVYYPDVPFSIPKLYPNAHSIRYYIMIREPTDRAVSGWRFHAGSAVAGLVTGVQQSGNDLGTETRSFKQAVEDGIRQRGNLEACYSRELLKIGPSAPPFVQDLPADQQYDVTKKCFWEMEDTHDITTNPDDVMGLMHAHVDKGIYVDQCRRWFNLLGRENFMVFSLEQWAADSVGVFLNISHHAGFEAVGPHGIPSLAELAELGAHKVNSGTASGEAPMPPEEEVAVLRSFYVPYTKQFEAYMGQSFW